MKRTKKRRYAREGVSVPASNSTHIIKMGWKAKKVTKNGRTLDLPFKLNGFLVCRDTVDNDGRPLIDYAAMKLLGFTRENIETALRDEFKAEASMLPQQLRFILMNMATAEEGGWDFDKTHREEYQLWGKNGLMCHGDGVNAEQHQTDGTTRRVPCVPYGSEGADPSTYCPHSGPDGDCKLKYGLSICLVYMDEERGGLKALSPEFGESARYRLESSAEWDSVQIIDEINEAAGRVHGLIRGLTGRLTFRKKNRRKDEGSAIVGSVLFSIDEASIRSREREIYDSEMLQRQNAIENKREGIEYAPISSLMIEGPAVIDVEPVRAPTPPATAAEPAPSSADPGPDPDIAVMITALGEWAELVGLENDEPKVEPLRRLMVKVDSRAGVVVESVGSVEWFRGDGVQAARREGRHELLRAVCEHLLDSQDKNFMLEVES